MKSTHPAGHKHIRELQEIVKKADETHDNDDWLAIIDIYLAFRKPLLKLQKYLKHKKHSTNAVSIFNRNHTAIESERSRLNKLPKLSFHLKFPMECFPKHHFHRQCIRKVVFPNSFFRKCFFRHIFCRNRIL